MLCEIGTRLFLRDKVGSADHSPPYAPAWGKKYLKLNSDGFRDRQHAVEKKSDVYRIVIIGDSYTFGWMVDNPENRYSEILEALLNNYNNSNERADDTKNFEIFNFAAPASNTRHELGMYENFARKYKPDLVLLCVSPLDIMPVKKVTDIPYPLTLMIQKSYFIRLIYFQLFMQRWRSGVLVRQIRDRIAHISKDPKTRNILVKNIKDFKKRCSRDGSNFIVVLLPIFDDFNGGHFVQEHSVMVRILFDSHVFYMDLFPKFKGKNADDFKVNYFDPHPNEKAHRIIAAGIFEQIVRWEGGVRH